MLEFLTAVAQFALALVIAILLRGLVLYKFWQWFLVPYTVVGELPYYAACGLAVAVSFFTVGFQQHDTNEEYYTLKALSYIYLSPILCLFTGYILTLFL